MLLKCKSMGVELVDRVDTVGKLKPPRTNGSSASETGRCLDEECKRV